MNRKWTKEMEDTLRRLYPDGHLGSLAFRLEVSYTAMRAKAKAMKLRRTGSRERKWTDDEMTYLREHYADTLTNELADKMGRTIKSINSKASKMRLRKSVKFLQDAGLRFAENPAIVAHRFKKGMTSANKGLRQSEFLSPEGIERSSKTRFQKGCKCHNAKPVGYEKFRYDKYRGKGYVFIKVEEGKPMILKHRWIWEQANGPIPNGYCLVFRDGNTRNCELSNLELINRVEHSHRTIHNETPEQRKARVAASQRSRNIRIRQERARITFGLPQKTKIHFSLCDKKTRKERAIVRCKLRRMNYIVDYGSNEVFYDDETERNDRMERRATACGLRLSKSP